MKKFVCVILAAILGLGITMGITRSYSKKDVVIFSSMEDFRNDKLSEMLKEKFPDKKIELQYYPSGNLAAKMAAEGVYIEADIVLDLEYGHLERMKNLFEKSDKVNYGDYLLGLRAERDVYLPISKYSCGIVVNTDILSQKGLSEPQSYNDLLKKEFKGTLMMPNPKASGTGYSFLMGMTNLLGEDAAFDYFSSFAGNALQFTSSGSGPVNALARGECAAGIGMVFQAVQQINMGAPLKVIAVGEGLPYNVSGMALVKGRKKKPLADEVFAFIANDFSRYDKLYNLPEQIFTDQEPSKIENYPAQIPNMDMEGFNDPTVKERLLKRWQF